MAVEVALGTIGFAAAGWWLYSLATMREFPSPDPSPAADRDWSPRWAAKIPAWSLLALAVVALAVVVAAFLVGRLP